MSEGVLRLLSFEAPPSGTTDDHFWHEISPDPMGVAGLTRTIVGRRSGRGAQAYVIATVWLDREAMMAAVRAGDVAVYHPSFAPYLKSAAVLVADLRASWWASDPGILSRIDVIRQLVPEVDAVDDLEESTGAASTGDQAGRTPCLVLEGTADGERVRVRGWSGTAPADAIGRFVARVRALPKRRSRMTQPGVGIEYDVIIDRAGG